MNELPLGFSMALAKNKSAMERFSALSEQQQKDTIAHTHQIQSKQEMQQFVQSITNKI
jgi:hypothetical protein